MQTTSDGDNEDEERVGNAESRSILDINMEIIKKIILKLKNKEAFGADKITNKFIKYGGEPLFQQITIKENL